MILRYFLHVIAIVHLVHMLMGRFLEFESLTRFLLLFLSGQVSSAALMMSSQPLVCLSSWLAMDFWLFLFFFLNRRGAFTRSHTYQKLFIESSRTAAMLFKKKKPLSKVFAYCSRKFLILVLPI